jgi:hypothetical protein
MPAYVLNQQNSLPIVRVTANNTALVLNTTISLGVNNWTVLVVTKFPKPAVTVKTLIGGATDRQLLIDSDSTLAWTDGTTMFDSGVTTNAFSAGYRIIGVSGTGIDATVDGVTRFLVDGLNVSSTWKKSIDPIKYIGNWSTNDQPFGDIAEIIIYNQLLSDEQRKDVEQYLLTKWNIDKDKYSKAVHSLDTF